jgi:F0F1-type ATP synthase membrane subunit b/b'
MSAKQFLLTLGAVAIVGWLVGNWLFGPPGHSKEYLDELGHEHEHYLEVTKRADYRMYLQRPHLHGPGTPGASPHLAEEIAFVEAYESRPEFIAEEERLAWYGTYFDFFNASLVLIIAIHFGRRPLLNLIDGRIVDLKEQMAQARENAAAAAGRKKEALSLIERLPDEESRVSEEMRQRQLIELADLESANRNSLELMKTELEERRAAVYLAAQERVKREMVDATISRIVKWHEAGTTPEYQEYLLKQFISDLEQHA